MEQWGFCFLSCVVALLWHHIPTSPFISLLVDRDTRNKRDGERGVGSAPARPHKNNDGAEHSVWRWELGCVVTPAVKGLRTDVQTPQGHKTTEARVTSPAPAHTCIPTWTDTPSCAYISYWCVVGWYVHWQWS